MRLCLRMNSVLRSHIEWNILARSPPEALVLPLGLEQPTLMEVLRMNNSLYPLLVIKRQNYGEMSHLSAALHHQILLERLPTDLFSPSVSAERSELVD